MSLVGSQADGYLFCSKRSPGAVRGNPSATRYPATQRPLVGSSARLFSKVQLLSFAQAMGSTVGCGSGRHPSSDHTASSSIGQDAEALVSEGRFDPCRRYPVWGPRPCGAGWSTVRQKRTTGSSSGSRASGLNTRRRGRRQLPFPPGGRSGADIARLSVFPSLRRGFGSV